MRILSAGDSRKIAGSVASLNRKWWMVWGKSYAPPVLAMTRYYPYYFQSWKVTAPKTLGRTAKVLLFTGVNGMNRSVGPATEWPVGEELEVDPEEVIPAHTLQAEAEELSREYIEKFVRRRYRPSKPSNIEREGFELVYVPYYVYAREGRPLQKAALIEGFTGAVGRVKDVPPVLQSILEERTVDVVEGR
ncbi:hypothetical protein BH24ACT22_BH24ACT22_11940 [soil metagenome]